MCDYVFTNGEYIKIRAYFCNYLGWVPFASIEGACGSRILLIRVSNISTTSDCSWFGLKVCLSAFFKISHHLED